MNSGAHGTSGVYEGATEAARRLLALLSSLNSRADVTAEHIGQQMGVTLSPKEGKSVFRSQDLGDGWIYGIQRTDPQKIAKAGFSFWFYNPDRTADPSAVCALSLAQLRTTLTGHGFVEQVARSEVGSADFVNFVKNDLVLTVTHRDIVTTPTGSQCLIGLQTTDGR